jgi:hypothetical protein
LTTRPPVTSRHGMIRLASIRLLWFSAVPCRSRFFSIHLLACFLTVAVLQAAARLFACFLTVAVLYAAARVLPDGRGSLCTCSPAP